MERQATLALKVGRLTGAALQTVFFVSLIGLPLAADRVPSQTLKVFDAFYRAGSLVFGGGHMLLPLLQANGWGDGALCVVAIFLPSLFLVM